MIKIANKIISRKSPVFIIAEAGVNHNNSLKNALKLVDAAAAAGADAVKFQTFRAEDVVTVSGKMAAYQKKNIGREESQLEMLKKLELKEEFYRPIIRRCQEKKIIFLSTPHGGFAAVDFLQSLKVLAFKFGSGDLTNLPLLQYAARLKKPMILGTGMATLPEVKEAVKCIELAGNKKIIVLHCTTNYPCPEREVNLRAMSTLTEELDVPVGYSDHTLGIQTSVMATALDARVIEKHFTLDKNMAGPDHRASLEPAELKEMVKGVRQAEIILGSGVKKPNKSEMPMIKTVRKSLVALKDIKKGEKFDEKNLGIKRPGTGLSPKIYNEILNKRAKSDIKADSLIKEKHYA
ncbi:N-acetylneuraminate synthase [Candidatus Falkowbacteria bacterium CG10_big_fil_rev_8_21_14_0_10_43_10]|uniref:N-acetylneuraminate synthase n=1 Tax=Candidatus Falkowbacteria bacterium CG10_big_fil_rev_8_21_14_0_10_43_10 TaxID=1974567 RepID=A0A2H0V280_9BACT|nr:MAG: N-acetylneuraminate synthase [Candidatus Falkowbacteria bacterium CG10_big_fil_rev_8_21_14_0_10_43_10]